MEKFDVLIVGGGPAGLSCAITLGSANDRFEWSKNRKYLIIDNEGGSDLMKALLNNVPGVPKGTLGKEFLKQLKEQALEYENVKFEDDRVVKIEETNDGFKVQTEKGKEYLADNIVLATGFHEFNIEGLDVEVVPNITSPRPGKIMIKHDGMFRVKDSVWVAGNAAGCFTMVASASGSGVHVACDIMSKWAGKNVVIHDVPKGK